MSEVKDQVSATTTIHDAIRVSGPDAVVFNPVARPIDLLAYAHGQMTILGELLLSLQDGDDSTLPYALRSVLEPATNAVELAASKLLSEARDG